MLVTQLYIILAWLLPPSDAIWILSNNNIGREFQTYGYLYETSNGGLNCILGRNYIENYYWNFATISDAMYINSALITEISLYVYGPLLLGWWACGMYCISCVELFVGNYIIATSNILVME